ncbi:MAG: cell division protein FtsA [Candidatus Omnitrophota bacterium]
MLNNNYICALDIGSDKIAACVATLKARQINNIFFENLPSRGVKDGIIVNSIDAVSVITKLLKTLKSKSGVNIRFVYTNISGQDIITKHSRAIMPLAERGNKVITLSDIQKVNEQARVLGSGLEEEIIHMIPASYAIDSKNNIANPFGLYSHRLEVDLYLICVKLSSVQSLTRVINQSGFEIKELHFSGLVTSKAVLNKKNEGVNLFCDIGSDITELLVFENGRLRDIEIMHLGGNELTRILSESLKMPFDLADEIKKSHGGALFSEQIAEDKEILIKKNNLYKPIKQRLVSELITVGTKSMCSSIKDAVNKKVSAYKVNNFTLTGGTAMMEGFIEILENTLNIPVKLGRISNPDIADFIKEDSALSGQKYLTYLTCLGMLCEAIEDKKKEFLPVNQIPMTLFGRVTNRIKEVYQEYF